MSGISTNLTVNQIQLGAIAAADERRVDKIVGQRIDRVEVFQVNVIQDEILADEVNGEVAQQAITTADQLEQIGRAESAEIQTERFASLREAILDFIERQEIQTDEIEKQTLTDSALQSTHQLDQVTEENLRLALGRAIANQAPGDAAPQEIETPIAAPPTIAIAQQILRSTAASAAPPEPAVDINRQGTSPELFERVFAAPVGQSVLPVAASEFSPAETGPEEVLERPPQNPINSQDQGTQTSVGGDSNSDSQGTDPQTTPAVDNNLATAPPLVATSPRTSPLTSFNPDAAIHEFENELTENDDEPRIASFDDVS